MPVDSIQSNTQIIGLSCHSPKFAQMQTYLKDPVDREQQGSIMKWIGKSLVNHSDALSVKSKDTTDVPVLNVHLLLQDTNFRIMDPGPVDDSHLYLQATHRSQSIWDTSSTVILSCRRREAASQRTIPFDQRIAPYLEAAGFLGVSQVGFMQLDWHLITALVERWRPETHTFHMPCGECTITLQDVAVQLGLPVDGEPLTGSLRYNWMLICNDYLGVVPPDMKGQRLSLPWLAEQFEELPPDADIVSVQRYARAYIMQLIGGFLFADKSNNLVHCMFLQFLFDFDQAGTYAWGAATLAWLYRELCRASNAQSLEIAGPLMLLQVWAYDRFSIIAPQRTLQHSDGRPLSFRWSGVQAASEQSGNMLLIYRWTFDRLSRSQINWTPYTPDIMASLPVRCQSGQAVWTYVGPLICFHLVEKHQPDRVLRQFNMLQTPPAISYTDQRLHQIDLRGKHDQDWRRIHAEHIGVWNSRYDFRVEAPTTSEPTVSENYFVWYRSITRRFITQEGAFYHCMYDFVDEVQTFSVEHDIEALGQICDRTTERVDHIIQQTRRLTVADTDRRRMRRRRRRQGDDVVEGDEDN
ncbi:serine/threonine-protein phosphatase 7 long form-like protein isoform X1 [Cucumis melo var. makuwa]|uniref:Serine/threonine-protein phosphatase 7 long form-like protein isoform X1 n=4 Tax=Cucumis melo TaxID=3656 RepID=A0A5D3BUF5_CUCMM|nr:serine/threonine-protein phosphatase 7 long form-like protein isoform X1 [Cucumis melo var. makuwa]TYK12342.1 serine/threonine-protein phosphatase 7 long form-like protein isoform X1 [Cucumis melo var. makuwa]